MASSVTETLSAHLEQVADEPGRYYDYDTTLTGKLKPSKVAAATRFLYRVPFVRWQGGSFRKYSADGGAMGTGTGPRVSHFTAGFFDSNISFEMTKEQVDLSKTSEQARINVVSEIVSNCMDVLAAHDNVHLFGDGTGKLTNAASASSSTTLTFGAAGDSLGVNRLFRGMIVDVWDSTGGTLRADGPYLIVDVDTDTKVVTFSASVTGVQSTDLLAVADADAYGPATLVSFSSTWPGGGTSTAAGLTGDSWRHGLAYVNDDTPSNYYLGRQKSSFADLKPSRVDANGALLTFEMVELGKNLTLRRRDKSVLNGLQGAAGLAQMQTLQNVVYNTQRIDLQGGASMKDLQPNVTYGDSVMVAGIPVFAVKGADNARIDFFNESNWGRVEAHPSEFYRAPDGGSYFFEKRSSDAVAAAWQIFVVQKFDWVCHDPAAGFFVNELAYDSRYDAV